jgi:hypothetical protein
MAVPGPMPPGAMPPGVPPPGGPPPGAPMPPPPMGMPPGMPPPPMGGAPPPMGDPLSDAFSDVSEQLPHHYQMLDAASRIVKASIASGAWYKEPAELAFLRSSTEDYDRIVSNFSSKKGLDLSGSPMGEQARVIEPDEEDSEDED